jgi:hypothetical protein
MQQQLLRQPPMLPRACRQLLQHMQQQWQRQLQLLKRQHSRKRPLLLLPLLVARRQLPQAVLLLMMTRQMQSRLLLLLLLQVALAGRSKARGVRPLPPWRTVCRLKKLQQLLQGPQRQSVPLLLQTASAASNASVQQHQQQQ